jgi:hypothetical protein
MPTGVLTLSALDQSEGSVKWNGQNGNYLTDQYITYKDPQCTDTSVVTAADGLSAVCTLSGLAIVVPQGTPGSHAKSTRQRACTESSCWKIRDQASRANLGAAP